jgi:hypothetical protein
MEERFYFIALSHVPILLIGLDYSKREASIIDLFYPTGDYAAILSRSGHTTRISGEASRKFIP